MTVRRAGSRLIVTFLYFVGSAKLSTPASGQSSSVATQTPPFLEFSLQHLILVCRANLEVLPLLLRVSNAVH